MDNNLPKDDSVPSEPTAPTSIPDATSSTPATNWQTTPTPPAPEQTSPSLPEQPLTPPLDHTPPPNPTPPPPPSWTSPIDVSTPESNPTPPAAAPAATTSSLFLPDGHELNHHGAAPKLIIGMLLVALILLGGGFFFMSQGQSQIKSETALIPPQAAPSPTPNPTAGWLTYTDSKIGFSLMYPPTGAFETGKPYFGTLGTQETPAAFMTSGGLLTILPNYKTATFTPLLTEPVMIGRFSMQKNFEATNSAVIKEVPISTTQTVAFTYKLPDDPIQAATVNKLFDQILSTFTLSVSSESASATPSGIIQ